MYIYKFECLEIFGLGVYFFFNLVFWIFFFFWSFKVLGLQDNGSMVEHAAGISQCWRQLLHLGIIPGACDGEVNKLDKVPDATDTKTQALSKHNDVVMIIFLQKVYRTATRRIRLLSLEEKGNRERLRRRHLN